MEITRKKSIAPEASRFDIIKSDFSKNKFIYLMFLPVLIWYGVFCYAPMYGAVIAFKDFIPSRGVIGSEWVGFKHFLKFFNDPYFWRLLRNTLTISINSLVWSFPIPIIFALFVNELKLKKFSKYVQTISSLPHFISLMVICGMIKTFTMDSGIITRLYGALTGDYSNLLNNTKAFVPIYIISGIWQEMGWNAIIYIAALAGVDQELYEAAAIDGAGKLRQVFAITIPGIMPTIIVLLILKLGGMLGVGYEKIILLYNPGIYETSDVISSYVYRKGIIDTQWSFSTAVGLFNAVINFILVLGANKLSAKYSETSLF